LGLISLVAKEILERQQGGTRRIGTRKGWVSKNPHPEGWGYTDKASGRGLKSKNDFLLPDLVSIFNAQIFTLEIGLKGFTLAFYPLLTLKKTGFGNGLICG
jgi:hypothetical protein